MIYLDLTFFDLFAVSIHGMRGKHTGSPFRVKEESSKKPLAFSGGKEWEFLDANGVCVPLTLCVNRNGRRTPPGTPPPPDFEAQKRAGQRTEREQPVLRHLQESCLRTAAVTSFFQFE